jgi:magnesium chelatase family protein
MTLARTCTAALTGIQAHLIDVEADIASGPPATVLAGLEDTQAREAARRLRDSAAGAGVQWPQARVAVTLSPASLPKPGDGTDLAMAVAVAAASGAVPPGSPEQVLFLAGLGPGGELTPVRGVLPAAAAAADQGLRTIVVAAANHDEAALVPGLRVISAGSLAEVAGWLRGGPGPAPPPPARDSQVTRRPPGLAVVTGQEHARRALEICAAGGHNLSLLGPAGSAKTAAAEQLAGILPDLDPASALEVTSLHSVAGTLQPGTGLITRPPFCAPHHTSSMASVIGGGSGIIRPGTASQAHKGVLLLDQAPEFPRAILDALRQPLDDGEIRIARAGMYAAFPARFIMVVAAEACPCGQGAPAGGNCACSPAARRRYLARISGPLLDRVDVKIALGPAGSSTPPEAAAAVAQRVAAARQRAAARLAGTPWRVSAEVPADVLRRQFPLGQDAVRHLDRAVELGQVSARGAGKITRVAWTIADLSARPRPGDAEVREALGLWLGSPSGPPGQAASRRPAAPRPGAARARHP